MLSRTADCCLCKMRVDRDVSCEPPGYGRGKPISISRAVCLLDTFRQKSAAAS